MKICTHNGPFHADEVLACAVLLRVHPNAEIERTRDPGAIESADVVVDVGGVFDPDKGRYDHHQPEGRPAPRENGVPYSSAGLVWREYGSHWIANYAIQRLVDEKLFQAVDALDNGFGSRVLEGKLEHATFSDAVAGFNPTWLEDQSPAMFEQRFLRAVQFATDVLERTIASCTAEVRARELVQDQYGEIVVIDRYAPVMDTLIERHPEALYLVFPSPGGEWMVQCVPPAIGSFDKRKALPETWAGRRGAALDQVTGQTGGIFCHVGRFICGATTKEQAIKLAELAVLA